MVHWFIYQSQKKKNNKLLPFGSFLVANTRVSYVMSICKMCILAWAWPQRSMPRLGECPVISIKAFSTFTAGVKKCTDKRMSVVQSSFATADIQRTLRWWICVHQAHQKQVKIMLYSQHKKELFAVILIKFL